jgi:hypothetical protein
MGLGLWSSLDLSGQLQEQHMYRTIAAVLISMFFAAPGFAQSACEALAVSKDGKPLAGAAKTAFVKKCKKDSCEPKAVSGDGKPLSGAAKNSFMKKCQNDA